jgi:hypothetical protein
MWFSWVANLFLAVRAEIFWRSLRLAKRNSSLTNRNHVERVFHSCCLAISTCAMSEFNDLVLYKLILIESRLLEFIDKKWWQVVDIIRKLPYTRKNWHLITFMLKKDPQKLILIILARFLNGLIPSLDMRIESNFLDVVFFPLPWVPFRQSDDDRSKRLSRTNPLTKESSTHSAFYKCSATTSTHQCIATCTIPFWCTWSHLE